MTEACIAGPSLLVAELKVGHSGEAQKRLGSRGRGARTKGGGGALALTVTPGTEDPAVFGTV